MNDKEQSERFIRLWNSKDEVWRASLIAHVAHYDDFRRDGVTPYIEHPKAVVRSVPVRQKPIAWLHDVLEDHPDEYNAEYLLGLGFSQYVVDAVVAMAKIPGELFADYISRVLKNPDAVIVKIADIEHNKSCNPTAKALVRYEEALIRLKEKQKENASC